MTAVQEPGDSAGKDSALGRGRKDSDVEEAERMFREAVKEKGVCSGQKATQQYNGRHLVKVCVKDREFVASSYENWAYLQEIV